MKVPYSWLREMVDVDRAPQPTSRWRWASAASPSKALSRCPTATPCWTSRSRPTAPTAPRCGASRARWPRPTVCRCRTSPAWTRCSAGDARAVHRGHRAARPVRPLRRRLRHRVGGAVAGLAAGAPARLRRPSDQQRGGRHQLRAAGAGPADARVRPDPAGRPRHPRAHGRARREDPDARRPGPRADAGDAGHRRRRCARRGGRRDGRRRLGGLAVDDGRWCSRAPRFNPTVGAPHQQGAGPQDRGQHAVRARRRSGAPGRGHGARVRAAAAAGRAAGGHRDRLPSGAGRRRDRLQLATRAARRPAGVRRARRRGAADPAGAGLHGRRGGRRLGRDRADQPRGRRARGGPDRRSGAAPWLRPGADAISRPGRAAAAERSPQCAGAASARRDDRRGLLRGDDVRLHRRSRGRAVRAGGDIVGIANPLSETFAVLRPSLVPGLLDGIGHNRRREQPDVRLFEIGARFSRAAGERRAFAFAWTGAADPPHWSAPPVAGHASSTPRAWSSASAWRWACPRRSSRTTAGWLVARPVRRRCRWRRQGSASWDAWRPRSPNTTAFPREDVVFVGEIDLDAAVRASAPRRRASRRCPASRRCRATSRCWWTTRCRRRRCGRPFARRRPTRWCRCASSTAIRARASPTARSVWRSGSRSGRPIAR